MWDVDFQTALAQAEIEDREIDGAVPPHPVRPDRRLGLGRDRNVSARSCIPACVALVVNPADDRYGSLVGRTVVTPLFGAEVPIVAHELAEPEKGTGIAMICTFGDVTDVTWWRELKLPTRGRGPARRHDRAAAVGGAGLGVAERSRRRSPRTVGARGVCQRRGRAKRISELLAEVG